MTNHVLYFSPGACSLSPHIALREAGLPFELERVDLRAKKLASGGDYLAVNPKGYVPALRLPDGQVLTENAVMIQYIADRVPDARLAPPAGTMERYRFQELLNFIATELHKGMSPLYSPVANAEYKAALKQRLAGRLQALAAMLQGEYLFGGRFTVADGYAFYALRSWQHAAKGELAPWPALAAYYTRLAARPTVAAALAATGVAP